MNTRHAWGCAATLCLTLAACSHPGSSAEATPSADSFRAETVDLRVGAAIQQVHGAVVTNAFFREGTVKPLVGRLFSEEEYQGAGARVVVIAASLWQGQFGGDPAAIGKTISINGQQHTSVGILPATFQFPTGAELWIPQQR